MMTGIRSEREKMLSGESYFAMDAELVKMRRRARSICRQLNALSDDDEQERKALIRSLFCTESENVWVTSPFHCDYGVNIKVGERVLFNFNCVVLDCAEVHIGDNVLIGPGVHIYTGQHPLDAARRVKGECSARSVVIGADVWIGGGAIICPGVRIGKGSVIGAGSVVTRDIPEGVVCAGNPCRVLRKL
ncbi:sugar O-acetyltransferase [Niveibacterium terrae]|uniref:sugar O-acetyltransferase n=1 Tax=Niveibacterium terrae TaxID=3373598 RepID=UPI003A8E548C